MLVPLNGPDSCIACILFCLSEMLAKSCWHNEAPTKLGENKEKHLCYVTLYRPTHLRSLFTRSQQCFQVLPNTITRWSLKQKPFLHTQGIVILNSFVTYFRNQQVGVCLNIPLLNMWDLRNFMLTVLIYIERGMWMAGALIYFPRGVHKALHGWLLISL